jgi:hypothetical protein
MNNTNEYINTTEYAKLETKLKNLVSVMDTLRSRNTAARKLRYTDIDIEVERTAGRLAPDEVFVPQHIIDTNIRREQASYVQYITQSNRACILVDVDQPSNDTSMLERDFTNRVRYNDWQIPMFANIDGMQQNGYGIVELTFDQAQVGHISYDFVPLGDFGCPLDTKDVQDAEILARTYYFSKTQLLEMSAPGSMWEFNADQVKKITDQEPGATDDITIAQTDRSLYGIQKVMFRVNGIVQVGWACENICDDWVRNPRPLFIGRKKAVAQPIVNPLLNGIQAPQVPQFEDAFETQYPYFVFQYLISENNTLDKLRGRVYLDQDTQTAVTSMISSVCTAYRRASGLYFSKNVEDPNDDVTLQKNVFFKQGALINGKITQFQMTPPDPSVLSAIQALVSANQAETSKVNFAAQNRKDSRKTATEISAAGQEAANLSTVQVVLYSTALKKLYTASFTIVQSRVAAGLIKVNPALQQLYARVYSVRSAGDVDVIERQQMVAAMKEAWPVIQATPMANAFLCDMLTKMFPDAAPKYIGILQQAMAQQQSAQAQQQQQLMQAAMGIGKQIVELSNRPEMFSNTGKVHALPVLQQVAQELSQFVQPTQVGPQQ